MSLVNGGYLHSMDTKNFFTETAPKKIGFGQTLKY